ncbi:MAG TPA: zinc-dependent metalloprotease [Marmoricola sp.]|nr:zinc-dependent metalloprotease [Marmoricola sp.]HMY07994.1 zinc-dependent metalloprotease [Marmoricola sp.]
MSDLDASSAPSMIDWELAVKVATKVVGDGPVVARAEAHDAVAELRAGAERSTPLVREFTGLVAAERTAPVLVVDRPNWVQANAQAFAKILTPIAANLLSQRSGSPGMGLGAKLTGAEAGLMLGFMGSKVLGQFDPFHEAPGEHGRLLLVAPNVVHIERELAVDPHDFRLWVCLHEETHRVQFTAVPWMADHLRSQMELVASGIKGDPTQLVGDLTHKVVDLFTGKTDGSLIDLMTTPEQKQVIDQITGVMSLLEGHADVVMDGVGPEVIPTVASIRNRFTRRRQGVGTLDKLLRRLLGIDQKMAQYRDGAVFVRAAVDKVGMCGFNAVWESPENLPSKAEILDPQLWITRVHG